MTEILKTALHCAAQGIKVFPVAGIKDIGVCACPKGPKCDQAGKHPVLPGSWKKYATTDTSQIKEWFSSPNYNLAIMIPDNLVVIDVDPKNGGTDTLVSFEKDYGSIGHSVDVETGSLGQHRLYRKPILLEGLKIKNRPILMGIDIKTSGGYIVGVGSRHKSGRYYRSLSPEGFDLRNLKPLENKKIIELILNDNQSKTNSGSSNSGMRKIIDVGFTDGSVIEGSRNTFLFSIACSLRARGFDLNQIKKVLVHVNSELCKPSLGVDEVYLCAESSARYALGQPKEKPTYSLSDPCFYGPLGDAVKSISESTESSAMAVLATLLTMCGNYLGRMVQLELGGLVHRANLFTIIVGSSAKGRKGTSYKIAQKVAEQFLDEEWFDRQQTGLISGEGIIHAVRDPGKVKAKKSKKLEHDDGVNDKRLFLYETELGRVLKTMHREGNSLSQLLRQAWDGGTLQNLSKNQPQKASRAHVSLIGHITQHELNEEICTNDIFNGFVNRCLWIYSERSRLLPFGGKTIDFLDYADLFYAFKLPQNSKIISIDDGARSYWAQIYQNENMDLPIPDDQQSVVEARGTDQILRMAIIYAVADQSSTVKYEHLQASLSVWKYSKLSSSFILGSANRGAGKNQARLLSFLSTKKSATRTEIRDFFQRNLSAEEINKIKDNLINENRIKIEQRGGAEVWVDATAVPERLN